MEGTGPAPAGRVHRPSSALLASLAAAVVALGPALLPGYVLLRDMVFVPSPALDARLLGLTAEAPRAVPSDAVVAVLSHVVPGQVVQKAVLLGILVAAGTGTGRLVRAGGVGSAAAGVAAVWNPYVGERLLMGHWALLIGYAALPWVALGLGRRLAGGPWRSLAVAVVAGSLGGASAVVPVALVVLGAVVVGLAGEGRGPRLRRLGGPVVLLLLCSVPWAVPGLLRSGRGTDPAGFEVFAPRADTPLGLVVSVLTGGGIWNSAAVPAGREALVPALGALAMALVAVGALAAAARRRALTGDVAVLVVAGALGLLLVLLAATSGPSSALAGLPGGGLLRDGARQSGPWVLLLAAGLGLAADAAVRHGIPALAYAVPLVPVAVLPLLAWGVGGGLRPTSFPDDVLAVNRTLAARPDRGAVAVLPYAAYRAYPWNGDRPSLTPWTRLLDRRTVTNADLAVSRPSGTVVVAGEDRLATAVGRALHAVDPAAALRAQGIRYLVVDVAGEPPPAGADVVSDGRHVRLYQLDGAVDDEAAGRFDPPVAPVVVADVLAVGAAGYVVVAAGEVSGRRGRRSSRSDRNGPP